MSKSMVGSSRQELNARSKVRAALPVFSRRTLLARTG